MPSKQMDDTLPAALYVVATPLGNLADLSQRASEVLTGASSIYAEDTRHSRHLLDTVGATTPLISLHEHNEARRIDEVLTRLGHNEAVALISDAGTPCISDPGYRLVAAVASAGHRVVPIPGPCAAIAALSAAGLPTDRFLFVGFLPAKEAARRKAIAELKNEPGTLVLYESPRRVHALLDDLHRVLGPRPVAIGRELTKLHEEILRGTLDNLSADLVRPQGEFSILVGGAPPAVTTSTAAHQGLTRLLKAALAAKLSQRTAVELARATFEVPRKVIYQQALALWGGADENEG